MKSIQPVIKQEMSNYRGIEKYGFNKENRNYYIKENFIINRIKRRHHSIYNNMYFKL